jgi:tetratricopeptide (TPR) repeat protein
VQQELEKGNRSALEERYVEALYHYRRALELYPDYSQARYNMARVLARMGEREMAREAYQQFLAADPFHNLAGKAQEAIREIDAGTGQP